MTGLRVVGLPRNTELHFSLESTYYTAECGRFVQLSYSLRLSSIEKNWVQLACIPI